MPRSGGIYTLPPGYFAVDGTTIEVSQHNPPLEDIAEALTDSLPRDGSAPMTGNLTMGGFKLTGLAAGTGPNDSLRFSQLGAFQSSVSALSLAVDEMVYANGVNTAAKTALTAFARTILDDANAAATRTTLGLGALATLASVTTTEIAAATLVTAAETIAANNNDTTIPTSAAVKGYADSVAGGTIIGINTTTGAATVGPWALPAGIKRFTITSNLSSLSGTGDIIIQLRVGGSFVTSGYSSRGVVGTSGNRTSTAGMIVPIGANTSFWDGSMEFWLHDPATNLWKGVATGMTNTTGSDTITATGSIALAGAVDGVQINSTAGTFDVSSFNVSF
jgi:hypothetical protein